MKVLLTSVALILIWVKITKRSLPNDATQLASNDSKRAHFINIPLSAKTFSAQVLDTKSPTDFLGFFAHLRVKSNEALDVEKKPKRGEWFFSSRIKYKTAL